MNLLDVLTHADWTRAVRFWILVATVFAAWESAFHFRRAFAAYFKKDDANV
ncbi:hypothetical protein PQR70_14580 [Paraburkholderia madseniana]|uniref:hypothetical protein n=1 Tax=Paraburkholderia madseniana TaxID=2599607 RepID=UPI0038BB6ACE